MSNKHIKKPVFAFGPYFGYLWHPCSLTLTPSSYGCVIVSTENLYHATMSLQLSNISVEVQAVVHYSRKQVCIILWMEKKQIGRIYIWIKYTCYLSLLADSGCHQVCVWAQIFSRQWFTFDTALLMPEQDGQDQSLMWSHCWSPGYFCASWRCGVYFCDSIWRPGVEGIFLVLSQGNVPLLCNNNNNKTKKIAGVRVAILMHIFPLTTSRTL